MVETTVLAEGLHGHILGSDLRNDARSHRLSDLDIVDIDEILDDFVLVLVKLSALLCHVGHSTHFLAGNGGLLGLRSNHLLEVLDSYDDRIKHENQHIDALGREAQKAPAMRCTDGFWDNLGENEDQHGEKRTDDAHEGGRAPAVLSGNLGGLSTDSGSTGGVGDGIQRKDGGDWPGRVLLELLHPHGRLETLVLTQRYVGNRHTHKRCLEYRAEE